MDDVNLNEAEWLPCTNPVLMLAHLQQRVGFRALRRKIRLFICACRRVGWELSPAADERAAIEVAERFADGRATHAERDVTYWKLFQDKPLNTPQMLAMFACTADNRLGDRAYQAVSHLVRAWTEAALGPDVPQRSGSEWKQWQAKHRRSVCYYLRDLFGNPFRTISVDSRWLEWNDRTVPKLAQAIYDERAFERLPILADALEEAGCNDADILNHCRQPGEHVRGCWVIDLLLGKS